MTASEVPERVLPVAEHTQLGVAATPPCTMMMMITITGAP